MEYIDFGYGYRLHKRDSANWELQEFRKPSNKGFAKNMEDKSPKWCDCGKFFQSLSAALGYRVQPRSHSCQLTRHHRPGLSRRDSMQAGELER